LVRDVATVTIRFCDEFEGGFGWIVEGEFMERCSHALVSGGRVWLIDPLAGDGVEERVRAAGEPAGVIQLLDRHNRDCRALAQGFGVPHYRLPSEPTPGAPFEFLVVRDGRRWKEVALWWPEPRVLVCADAIGTARYFRAGDERIAVHPLLRPIPPRQQLGELQPETVLCGHGEGILSGAAPRFQEALSTARRRILPALASAVRVRR
jgi:hypothetical protein